MIAKKTKITFLILISLSLFSCGGNQNVKPVSQSPTPKQQKIKYTLPDGEIVSGYKKRFSGGYYIGNLKDNQPHGRGAFIGSNNAVSVGDYTDGKADGLHKIFNTINGLVSYNLIKDGKSIQQYGELDAMLASGDFEAAAKTRGTKVFLGIQLKDETPYINALRIIKNAPADLAGIKKNDKIMSINGESFHSRTVSNLLLALIKLPYDKPITIELNRNGIIKTITMIPGIIPASHPHATASADLLWNNTKAENSSTAYQNYINTITDNRYKHSAQRLLNRILKAEKAAYSKLASSGTSGLYKFCRQYPNSSLLSQALSAHFQKIENNSNFIGSYSELIRNCPLATKYQPASYELLNVGPTKMKVSDLLHLLEKNMSSKLIATKIKTGEHIYKDFSLDEISQLNSFGMKDEVISAMIESTFNKKKADEVQARLNKLEEENNKLRAQALKNNHRQSQQKLSQKQQQEKSMPLECIKLAASLKACDQASGFLSMGCKAMARSEFDCPIPLK